MPRPTISALRVESDGQGIADALDPRRVIA